MKKVAFDFPDTGKVFAIGANGDYLRHFVREFVRGGGAPDRLVVIRDAQRCVEPIGTGLAGPVEHATHAPGLGKAEAGYGRNRRAGQGGNLLGGGRGPGTRP